MPTQTPFRFTVLAHVPELLECVRRCADVDKYDIDYKEITAENAVATARQCLEDGTEIIICHGGLRNSISRAVGHSVVTIGRTDIDVINTMKEACLLSKELAYGAWVDEVQNIATLEKFLDVKLYHFITDDYAHTQKMVKMYYDQGVRVLVGSGASKRAMEDCGGTGFSVIPNEYSIRKAFRQAASYALQKRALNSSTRNLYVALDQLDEAAVCVDSAGKLSFVTTKALHFLRLTLETQDQVTNFFAALHIPETLAAVKSYKDIVAEIGNEQFILSTIPVSMDMGKSGALALFRDASTLQQQNLKVGEAEYSKSFTCRYTVDSILGSSPGIGAIRESIRRLAPTDAAVLIHGETGTGKELAAHAVHAHSRRRPYPFVAVNCAAMPQSLLESELFGYEGGAFTGAQRSGKPGLFEMAHKGTLFLDEIGEMGHEMQLRLLRVLEAKEVMRLGGRRLIPVDVRIVCASHTSLQDLMAKNAFRQDLYYRISTLKLTLPPLRERMEDVGVLVAGVLKKYNKSSDVLTGEIQKLVQGYAWPGNIRELLSIIESYCLLMGDDDGANAALFSRFISENGHRAVEDSVFAGIPAQGCTQKSMQQIVDAAKAAAVAGALRLHGNDKYAAATSLGISYPTLWRIVQRGKE